MRVTDSKLFYIKDYHINLFYEFVEEVNKIPDTKSKLEYIKRILYRVTNIYPFRIITKYFIDRIIYGEVPTIRVLPLTTEEANNKTTYQINLPQLDLLISKGLNTPRFRQDIEDWIYSTKGVIQRFICDYANCENIFKIPKTDLKDMIETPRLRIYNCKVYDLKEISDNFVGYNKPYLQHIRYIPKEYLESDRINLLPNHKQVRVFTNKFWRDIGRKNKIRNGKKYDYTIQQGIPSSYRYKFPAIVFQQDQEKSPLYYFIRRNELTYTNMKGMMKQHFAFYCSRLKHIAFAGYYRNETFYTIVCTTLEPFVRHIIEGKAGKYFGTPTTYMSNYESFRKVIDKRSELYNIIPRFSIGRKKGTPLMDMHHLLNYLFLNKMQWKHNLVIMFLNNVIFSPKHLILKCVMLEFNNLTNMVKLQTLDENKDTFYVHKERISDISRNLKYYVGKTVYMFRFEIGGDFLLLEPLKSFTWESEEYYKGSVKKLTVY